MKILHLITSLRTGGAERLVTELSKWHQAGGDEVSVALFDGTPTPMTGELENAGVKVHALGQGPGDMRNPLLLPRLRHLLRDHPQDIVHTHNTACQLLAAMTPFPQLVTTEHNSSNRRRSWPWFRPIDRWMYGRYRKIICVGEETRTELEKWLDRESLSGRMSVIPNGINPERLRLARPAEEMTSAEGHRILMVSAFRPEKDQETLIRAMKRLPEDYILFLAGGAETPADQAALDRCMAVAGPLGDRVRFLGIRKDVPSLLAAADIVVQSSHHEGMSLSMLEGMASGKPLVASDVTGLREVVGGAGILFPEGDDKTLAETLHHLCSHQEQIRDIGERCRQRAGQYDIAETARRYRTLYQESLLPS